jgi:hypothetical protein
MATVAEFLGGNPIACKPDKTSETVTLEGVVTAADEQKIEFLHFGRHFSVSHDDVLNIVPHPHPAGPVPTGGKPVILTLKSAAVLEWKQPLTASELSNAVPFAFALPPIAVQLSTTHNAAATEWMGKVGFAPSHIIGSGSTTGSTCTCTTQPGDKTDDTKWDDW